VVPYIIIPGCASRLPTPFEKTKPSFEHKILGFELLETGLSEKRTAGPLASHDVDLLIAVRNSKLKIKN
jgi:hypothetical protein